MQAKLAVAGAAVQVRMWTHAVRNMHRVRVRVRTLTHAVETHDGVRVRVRTHTVKNSYHHEESCHLSPQAISRTVLHSAVIHFRFKERARCSPGSFVTQQQHLGKDAVAHVCLEESSSMTKGLLGCAQASEPSSPDRMT